MVTASADGTVTIAAPGVERPERVIHVGAEPMTAQFIPGGLLGIETYGGWAGIWDAHGRRFQIRAESWYISPAFTGDGRRAVAAEEEGTATLWNVATGDIVRTFGRRRGGDLDTATVSADGKIVVTAGDRTDVWGGAGGARVRRLATKERPVLAAVVPDGRTVLTVSPGEVLLWPVAGGRPVALPGTPDDIPDSSVQPDLARLAHFAPDGRSSSREPGGRPSQIRAVGTRWTSTSQRASVWPSGFASARTSSSDRLSRMRYEGRLRAEQPLILRLRCLVVADADPREEV